MPKFIYSKVNKELLLVINKKKDILINRTNLSPDDALLQASSKILTKNDLFKPHKHNNIKRETLGTNEAWVILSGSIEAQFWDIDDTPIHKEVLEEGDCVVVFSGGHGFKVQEEGTILYEFQNGPYFGQVKDKTFIHLQENN
jgi:mannose-6-phosphate isomerase-like protein (cupin superfamily)